MKKLFLLTIVLFLATGCSATANISIDQGEITESIEVVSDNDNEYKEVSGWYGFPLTKYYDQELENPFGGSKEKESGVPYYDTKFDETQKKVTATATFETSEHIRSSVVRGCFQSYNVAADENDPNLVTFATSEGLICDFSNFNIVVNTPYKVVQSNASSVDQINNTYTWKINDSNKMSASVSLVVDFSKRLDENGTTKENKETNEPVKRESDSGVSSMFIYIVIISIIFIIVILLLILKAKKNKVSEV